MNRTKGELFGKWREYLGLSQMEIYEKIGITPKSQSNWENGLRNPKDSSLKKFCEAYEIQWFDFLNGSDEYERRRRAREERELNNQTPHEVKGVPYDLTRFSKVFPLSRLTRPITKLSPAPLGWTPVHQMKENPLQWINVYVDRESGGGCGIPYGKEAAVYLCVEGDTDSMPQAVDIVLVYNKSEGSRFIEWKETTAVGDFDTVHGVAAIDEEWIVR